MKGLILPNTAGFLQRMGIGKIHQLDHKTFLTNKDIIKILNSYLKEIEKLNNIKFE